ncbi:hypothetical protein N3K66_000423 [Trichothecium roseum]|uniref:Uncharacterized protein n=1 Tax=Trichothecium roseum TaxID=47278 RepID=A0ACC0VBW4_9HYPO|nr:hypothetical protein N3K66_000423 [Trichothecium roseum]
MHKLKLFVLFLSAPLLAVGFPTWSEDQVSTTICFWDYVRAAIIRDTIYFDGGDIWWSPKFEDGSAGNPVRDTNWGGRLFSWNLSTPFDSKTNTTEVLLSKPFTKARNGEGNSNSDAPNYIDGGLLYNDAQFLLYGGVVVNYTYAARPDADDVLGYQAYEYGQERGAWERGWQAGKLGDDVTNYVAYGAAVSAPSENKAWYFSGLTAEDHGEILKAGVSGTQAQNISDRLIQVDMETQSAEKWTNLTLGSDVNGRASAEAVWVPVGKQGILVVLGGVIYPSWITSGKESEDPEASKKESPKFMQDIDIYDVESEKWYKQSTKDGPGARTKGCAVVASASDNSTFNIYYYGGFDGLASLEDYYDDVWVLSLPTFSWVQLNKGKSDLGRIGHNCFSPAPNQMLVFGGTKPLPGNTLACVGDIVRNFNLSSGEWLESYHPDDYDDYSVPEQVFKVIGGDASGGGDSEPKDGFDDDGLKDIFGEMYDTSKIQQYGPFPVAEGEKDRPNLPGDDGDGNKKNGGGLPGWVAPVLGVILGLIAITTAVVFLCLYRRRKIFKNRSSVSSAHDNGPWILSWLKGQSNYTGTEKAPTVTTTDDTREREQQVYSPDMADTKVFGASARSPTPRDEKVITPEMQGTPIAELDASPRPPELSNTELTPEQIIQRHSRLGRRTYDRRVSDPSYSSFSGNAAEMDSTVSRSSNPQSTTNPDDAAPQATPPLAAGGMWSMSEAMAEGEGGTMVSEADRPSTDRKLSDQAPVSPPSAGATSGEDYMTARAALASPLRKDVLHEEDEHEGKA